MNNLEFAISMENDGESYYTHQAEMNRENSLYNLFLNLAHDEKIHAKILRNKFDGKSYELSENTAVFEPKSLFKGADDFKIDFKKVPSQLDLYNVIFDREKASVELYKEMLASASNPKDQTLFEFLVVQETKHQAIFEGLVSLLTRPEEWVENAEFGVREEY